jgi:hypothetical protein
MEQMLIKRRVIINKNKKQKHVVFYFVVYVCMQGVKGADKILELREAKGDLELDDLNQVPYPTAD